MIEGKSEHCYKAKSFHFKCFKTGPTKLLKFCCDWIFCIVTEHSCCLIMQGIDRMIKAFFSIMAKPELVVVPWLNLLAGRHWHSHILSDVKNHPIHEGGCIMYEREYHSGKDSLIHF